VSEGAGFLGSASIFLGAAVVAVPLSHRLGLGSIVGYLAAGVAIGPAALRLIASPDAVLHVAELGVVLLLFLVGLELNPSRLWALRRPILGMGAAQVASAVAVFALAGALLGAGGPLAAVAGMGFAMSSTALALQLLDERGARELPAGRSSFAVLLFQDLAVIPMLALLPLLAPAAATAVTAAGAPEAAPSAGALMPALRGVAAILGVVVLGRTAIRPLFRLIAGTGLKELFTAFSLLLVVGIASLMQAVGLSMELGTFLAGVLLADSEYRHQLEIDIQPFKGLLLGLFFMAVGMTMDMGALGRAPLAVLGLTAALITGKVATLLVVARAFGHSLREGLVFALALSQGGEFAFVLFGVAERLGIATPAEASVLSIAVALSMAATPFLFIAHDRLLLPLLRDGDDEARRRTFSIEPDQKNPVILAGYGRVGQVIGRLLSAQRIGVTILEQDPGQIEVVRRFGWKAYYGDVSRMELLEAAGAAEAKLLVLAIDDMEAARRTVDLAREHFPHLKLLVRAESRLEAYEFLNLGVPVVRVTWAPGLEMGESALRALGYGAFEAHTIAQRFERYDATQLLEGAKIAQDETA